MENHSLRKTPLYRDHEMLGGKLVPFAGWLMPLSYTKINHPGALAEHRFVREHCGIFDVSHMGEILVMGSDSLPFLDHVCMNDISRLSIGFSQYSACLNEEGGFLDDLIVYRLESDRFLICVNASNTEKIYLHLKRIKEQDFGTNDVEIVDESAHWSQIAVQGPGSLESMASCFPSWSTSIQELDFGQFTTFRLGQGESSALISRTGYTGEKGYEIYLPSEYAVDIWRRLSAAPNTQPAGLAARDSLRLEAGFPLYGNELAEDITPFEAGLSWAFAWKDRDFIGKDAAIRKDKDCMKNKKRRIFAFKMEDSAVPRTGMPVFSDANSSMEPVGVVSSGAKLPTLDCFGGLCFLRGSYSVEDNIWVSVRDKLKKAKIVKKPLFPSRAR
jgi:aminomethyltransferase